MSMISASAHEKTYKLFIQFYNDTAATKLVDFTYNYSIPIEANDGRPLSGNAMLFLKSFAMNYNDIAFTANLVLNINALYIHVQPLSNYSSYMNNTTLVGGQIATPNGSQLVSSDILEMVPVETYITNTAANGVDRIIFSQVINKNSIGHPISDINFLNKPMRIYITDQAGNLLSLVARGGGQQGQSPNPNICMELLLYDCSYDSPQVMYPRVDRHYGVENAKKY